MLGIIIILSVYLTGISQKFQCIIISVYSMTFFCALEFKYQSKVRILYTFNIVIVSFIDFYGAISKIWIHCYYLFLRTVLNQSEHFFSSYTILALRIVIILYPDFKGMHQNLNVLSFTIFEKTFEVSWILDIIYIIWYLCVIRKLCHYWS